MYPSETLSRLAGRPVLLKAENLQRTGSFKIRGAYNTIAQLSADERRAGVVTASAGNHGQAVAWAAREAGIPATIVVPEAAPMAKVEAARGVRRARRARGRGLRRGGRRGAGASRRETGATFVHAFEDPRVIAGQGTLGLELAEQLPEAGDGRHPRRRRRARGRHRDRAPRAAARLRLVGVQAAACVLRRPARGYDDRRRDRRQAARRADVADPRRAARRHRRGRRGGDLAGDRAAARAREARRRGRGRGARRRARRRPRRRRRARVAPCSPAATSTRRRSTP